MINGKSQMKKELQLRVRQILRKQGDSNCRKCRGLSSCVGSVLCVDKTPLKPLFLSVPSIEHEHLELPALLANVFGKCCWLSCL